jgi:signal peptidase II
MWRYLWIAAAVFICDQLTKYAAAEYLLRHGEVKLAPFLSFVLVHNTGAAFGILSNAGGWQNIFFISLALIACVVILWVIRRLGPKDILIVFGLIDVYYRIWHWPAFNIADSAITIGAVLLAVDALVLGSRHRQTS